MDELIYIYDDCILFRFPFTNTWFRIKRWLKFNKKEEDTNEDFN